MPGHGIPPPDPAAWPPEGLTPPAGPPGSDPTPPYGPPGSGPAPPSVPPGSGPNPPYGPPGPGPNPPAGTGGALRNPNNRLGVLSVVAGLLTLVCECLPFVSVAFGVAAVVLGLMHHQRFRAGTASAPNLALVGIVLGVVGLVLSICFGVSSIGDRLRHDVHLS
jgi:hypothetical protein